MDYKSQKDEDLAQLLQEGDDCALSEIIARYQEKLHRYVSRMVGSDDDASDLVQDTFIKFYQNIKAFDPKRKLSSWIYRIAHNSTINYIKKSQRTKTFELDVLDWLGEKTSARIESQLNDEKDEFLIGRIPEYLDRIRDKYKEIIILYFYEEKSYEEISDILKIPVSTVGVWLRRAKLKIKKEIEKENYGYGYAKNQPERSPLLLG